MKNDHYTFIYLLYIYIYIYIYYIIIVYYNNYNIYICTDEGSGKLKHEFWDLLRYNKELLDEYVIAEVPQETIEKWMIRKASLKAKKRMSYLLTL